VMIGSSISYQYEHFYPNNLILLSLILLEASFLGLPINFILVVWHTFNGLLRKCSISRYAFLLYCDCQSKESVSISSRLELLPRGNSQA